MKQISTADEQQLDLPFSEAIVHENTVFLSGNVPIDETGEPIDGDIEAQTAQTMENIAEILKVAGSSLDNLIKTTVLLIDIDDFEGFNDAYIEYVSPPYPARCAYGVDDIAIEVDIEIDAIAALDE